MRLPFVFAKRFVAGESLEQTVPEVQELNQGGIAVTLDLLGENVTERKTADETVSRYMDILKNITKVGLDATIFIKATMMGLSIDRTYCRDNLFRLLEVAREKDQFVRIDMEGSNYTQATIDLFKEAFNHYGDHVGVPHPSLFTP